MANVDTSGLVEQMASILAGVVEGRGDALRDRCWTGIT